MKLSPDDYTALVMMSKCMLFENKFKKALKYAQDARNVYPQEAQSYYLSGFIKTKLNRYEAAIEDFNRYDAILPGNPNSLFFKGYAFEGMGRTDQAASQYNPYLQIVNQGPQAEHAYQRLVEWGYIQP